MNKKRLKWFNKHQILDEELSECFTEPQLISTKTLPNGLILKRVVNSRFIVEHQFFLDSRKIGQAYYTRGGDFYYDTFPYHTQCDAFHANSEHEIAQHLLALHSN